MNLDREDPSMMMVAGDLDNSDTPAVSIRSDIRRLKSPAGLLILDTPTATSKRRSGSIWRYIPQNDFR